MLYYKTVQENLGEQLSTIDFPPSGNAGFKLKRTYEGNGFLQVTKLINIDNEDSGVVFTVYMQPNRRVNGDQDSHDVMVFASTQ